MAWRRGTVLLKLVTSNQLPILPPYSHLAPLLSKQKQFKQL